MHHEEHLLILTKTYPIPSASYRETTCVAAVNSMGNLRRLYPIPYRLMDGEKQFKRWEWIKGKIEKTSDRRPESHSLDVDSIQRLSVMSTKNGWSERLSWISKHLSSNFIEMDEAREKTGKSIGFLRPSNFRLIIQEAEETEWDKRKIGKLPQIGLFDDELALNRPELRKVPYDFYYEFQFDDEPGTPMHKHKINDWEISMLYWKCAEKYGSQWDQYFRMKAEKEFQEKRDLILMMGTMHRLQKIWLIIGVIYPPKQKFVQPVLFSSAPDGLSQAGNQ